MKPNPVSNSDSSRVAITAKEEYFPELNKVVPDPNHNKSRTEDLNVAILTGAIKDLTPVKQNYVSKERRPSVPDSENHEILKNAIGSLKAVRDTDMQPRKSSLSYVAGHNYQDMNSDSAFYRGGDARRKSSDAAVPMSRPDSPPLLLMEVDQSSSPSTPPRRTLKPRASIGSTDTLKGGLAASPRSMVAPDCIVINKEISVQPRIQQPRVAQQSLTSSRSQRRRFVGMARRRSQVKNKRLVSSKSSYGDY